MSFRQVRKPHMKNSVVTTASGAPYETEVSDVVALAAVEVPGVTIAMVNHPFARNSASLTFCMIASPTGKQGSDSILHWVKDEMDLGLSRQAATYSSSTR